MVKRELIFTYYKKPPLQAKLSGGRFIKWVGYLLSDETNLIFRCKIKGEDEESFIVTKSKESGIITLIQKNKSENYTYVDEAIYVAGISTHSYNKKIIREYFGEIQS